jgi:hypothetical protein
MLTINPGAKEVLPTRTAAELAEHAEYEHCDKGR